MRAFTKLFFTAILTIAIAAIAQAQSSSLSGQITDASGAVIADASVKAVSKDKSEFVARADSYGVYSFKMPGGSYRLEFKITGCKDFVVPEYILGSDSNARLDAEIPLTNCRAACDDMPFVSPVTAASSAINMETTAAKFAKPAVSAAPRDRPRSRRKKH